MTTLSREEQAAWMKFLGSKECTELLARWKREDEAAAETALCEAIKRRDAARDEWEAAWRDVLNAESELLRLARRATRRAIDG